MAEYIGIQGQIRRNNLRSVLLLAAFPLLILAVVWVFFYLTNYSQEGPPQASMVNDYFVSTIPGVIIAVSVWFLIAWISHSFMIKRATGSMTLERKENKRVYNLVENLCIASGMPMPKVNVIPDDALNAFASGISTKSYTVTLTQGIIEKLDDDELEGVIAHELMHIQNRDVRLLIISIIFVGIFSFVAQLAFRNLLYGGMGGMGGNRRKQNDNRLMIIAVVIAIVAYLLSVTFRFAISRNREYMADSGAAELTKNPRALASALKKISGNHKVSTVKSPDVAEMFIENTPDKSSGIMASISGLFATHPPIEKRIQLLEQF
ncbi:MAG: M48 family metallopeptidase [Bacteroidota bacterium]|nr:M48 family metallopeptidase [Bacteroidota bacterium]